MTNSRNERGCEAFHNVPAIETKTKSLVMSKNHARIKAPHISVKCKSKSSKKKIHIKRLKHCTLREL